MAKETTPQKALSATTPPPAHDTVILRADVTGNTVIENKKPCPASRTANAAGMAIGRTAKAYEVLEGPAFHRFVERHRGGRPPGLWDIWPMLLFFGFLGIAAFVMGIAALFK